MGVELDLLEIARNDRKELYDGPSVSFAFKQSSALIRPFSEVYEIAVSFQDRKHNDLEFQIGMVEKLQSFQKDKRWNKEDYRFNVKVIIVPGERQNLADTMLYVSVGASPEYAKNDNRDMTDAMYDVDAWGLRILLYSHEKEHELVWASSDYNFNGIPRGDTIDINSLKKMVGTAINSCKK